MDTTWATPKAFFEMLNNEFNFTVDVCALEDTAKVSKYFTPEIEDLKRLERIKNEKSGK